MKTFRFGLSSSQIMSNGLGFYFASISRPFLNFWNRSILSAASRRAMVMALMLVFMGTTAEAQETETVELEAVTVVGRKIEEKLSAELAQYGHQVHVIPGDTIEKMGYVDISEALNALAPGLYMISKGRGDYNTAMMSGNYNSSVLWLLDGIRLNNRLYGVGYVDAISVKMIDRIEILYGGEGLFYGTNATAGVINIITKKPTDHASGQFSVSYGSNDMVEVAGYASDSLNGNKFLVFGSYDSWDGYTPYTDRIYKAYNNTDRRKRGYDRTNIGLKYQREFGEDNLDKTLEFHVQRNSGKFDYLEANLRNGVNDRTENIMTAKWSHDVTDNYSYYVKAYFHDWWTDYTTVNLKGEYVTNASEWGFQDWGINFLNSYRFDRGDEVLLGFDYQNYYASSEHGQIRPKHAEVYAAFTQYRPYFSFWPDWKMAFGLRYNHQENYDSVIWNVSSRMPFFEDRLFLRANVGTSFILPTAEQLYSNDTSWYIGNENLKPQDSFALNVGLGANFEKGSLEVSYFNEVVDNMINTDKNGVYQNLSGKTKIYGYTVSGSLNPVQSLTLTASHTRQKAKQDGEWWERNNVPKHFSNFGLQWDDKINDTPLGLGIFARHIGRIPVAYTIWGTEYSHPHGNYWVADASIYAGLTEKSRVSLYLANIFDEKYAVTMRPGFDSQGVFYYEYPLGNPFSATLTFTYDF